VKSNLLACQVPGCGQQVSVRSTIKTEGPLKGKKCCPSCKNLYDKKVKAVPAKRNIQPITEKTKAKRKLERSGLPEFFHAQIQELKVRPVCDNCKKPIKHFLHPVNNIAHILSKRKYKSVMLDKNNVLFLCADKDETGNNCHYRFDNHIVQRSEMPVFGLALKKVSAMLSQIKESGKELEMFQTYLENGLH
jgi:hypothetical protein